MNKRDMLENLVNYYADGKQKDFAKMIGISASLLNKWLSRNSFDAEIIYAKCPSISAEWLLTGEGEMLKSERINNIDNVSTSTDLLDEHTREILRLCKSLIESYKQRDAVMDKLVSMFN